MTVDKTSLTPPKADPALIQQEVKTDQVWNIFCLSPKKIK